MQLFSTNFFHSNQKPQIWKGFIEDSSHENFHMNLGFSRCMTCLIISLSYATCSFHALGLPVLLLKLIIADSIWVA